MGRDMTVEQAVYGGLLSLEGESSELGAATTLVESFLKEERKSLSLVEPWGAA